jgi:fructokinase
MNKKYNVVGIGNAIVDISCLIEEKFLEEHNLTKGGMFLIDRDNIKILAGLKYQKISSGGSVANSIATLAMLDSKTALIGKVGDDKFGNIFFNDLKNIGSNFFCRHKDKKSTTAQSFVLITPDGERTMCTYLGVASKIETEIDENIIKDAELLYIEGYLWDEPETIAAIYEAIMIAKDNDVKVAFSLSDAFCVERHRMDFLSATKNFDILFSNEIEMSVLIGKDFADNNYQKVKDAISHFSPNLTIAMTVGKKGSVVFEGTKNIYNVPTNRIDKIVDTTGAGDAFAAGFLYGIDNDLEIKEAATLGNILAGGVIQQFGARIEKEKILELIK